VIRIEHKLAVAAPPQAVWRILSDPFEVAMSLPGATVTERRDDGSYLGHVTVKVGPLGATYRGVMRFERLDSERFEVELVGQGLDAKGRGSAEMRMTSRLVPLEDGGTEVHVTADIGIKGILAQLGRGMLEGVSARLFQQFGAALERRLERRPDAAASGA